MAAHRKVPHNNTLSLDYKESAHVVSGSQKLVSSSSPSSSLSASSSSSSSTKLGPGPGGGAIGG